MSITVSKYSTIPHTSIGKVGQFHFIQVAAEEAGAARDEDAVS